MARRKPGQAQRPVQLSTERPPRLLRRMGSGSELRAVKFLVRCAKGFVVPVTPHTHGARRCQLQFAGARAGARRLCHHSTRHLLTQLGRNCCGSVRAVCWRVVKFPAGLCRRNSRFAPPQTLERDVIDQQLVAGEAAPF
eukprot:scaffold79144_cov69-Phaeocystis_antarctica.AAC.2